MNRKARRSIQPPAQSSHQHEEDLCPLPCPLIFNLRPSPKFISASRSAILRDTKRLLTASGQQALQSRPEKTSATVLRQMSKKSPDISTSATCSSVSTALIIGRPLNWNTNKPGYEKSR